jgi:PHD/YefM family antitoxin component YafN of YafNO toxin-antitoxin module
MNDSAKYPTGVRDVGELPRTTASTLKRVGWRGVRDALQAEGPLVVTNHDKPEAVILPVDRYQQLVALAAQDAARVNADLAMLREQFDRELAVLQKKPARERVERVFDSPVRLKGKVRAGTGY